MEWAKAAQGQFNVPKTAATGGEMTLFTDASLKGWGAVLITANAEVHVAGGPWRAKYTPGDISALEAQAVTSALNAFAELLAEAKEPHLTIAVDNTSVVAAVRRGVARSLKVNEGIKPALEKLRLLGKAVEIRYIATRSNPADGKSRGSDTVDESLTREAVQNVRGGGGGRREYYPVVK